MAAVYAAEHVATAQRAAIKLLHPEMSVRGEIRERFLREAAVMARIQHPGTVTVYEQGQSGNSVYLAMELLSGETVADRVRRLGRLASDEVLSILDQVLDVLATAHAMGVIHRDLKPDNLFLTTESRVKVLDFGLARLLDGSPQSFRTRPGAALGTLPYMAPEQALGRRDEIDARTDLFALGATAFRLLTGRRIHEAKSEAALLTLMATEPAPPLTSIAPDVNADLGAVIDRSLCFSRHGRYADARAMQYDIRALLAGERPHLAIQHLEGEARATLADRQFPHRDLASSPQSSTRPLEAFGVGPASSPTRLDRGASKSPDKNGLGPDAARAPLPRDLSPTVAMPQSVRTDATVVELSGPAATVNQIAVNIPNAPLSEAILTRQHRRRFTVGWILLLVMLVAVTSAGVYWMSPRRSSADATAASGSAEPSPPASSLPKSRNAAGVKLGPRWRHPETVVQPLDEGDAAPPKRHPK
jgi:serine/threonine-protein kinase